ncbi:GNAT family N-acetyltransferase [Lacibacter luteus]|uniref:GNAT family N-acetyltransferase n=1 Tax=Lacibacter luteus TaxID=2508719 RepID=A0A4Q1CLF9_9BACT|nr:GNAT family N-acetyltransferase [Lacibacter luteus]RXK61826.1 GNAT family N-acetyltransferase [Lacibacter luteus]
MIAQAVKEDIPQLVDLLNSAYRGERSQKGWTTESHLIAGDVRTDETDVLKVLQQPGSIILKYTNDAGEIIGTVNLQQHDRGLYLGMFAVDPNLQGGGIGKQLLKAADEYAKKIGSVTIYMSVISVRKELIDWYKRHGYAETGERKPFVQDDLTGAHLQQLEFLILEKQIH